MLPPLSRFWPCALLVALVAGAFAWVLLSGQPVQVEAIGAPAAGCPCERPQGGLTGTPLPETEPDAAAVAVPRRDRFLGRTAELRDWHRAGRPGDLRVDLQAATLAIRNLGGAGDGIERRAPSEPADVASETASWIATTNTATR